MDMFEEADIAYAYDNITGIYETKGIPRNHGFVILRAPVPLRRGIILTGFTRAASCAVVPVSVIMKVDLQRLRTRRC